MVRKGSSVRVRQRASRNSRSPGPASAVGVLSAGGTVARAASEARRTFPNVETTTRPPTDWRRCPADEQPQRGVVRALRLALGQRLTLDRPKPRATAGIDDG